MPKTLDPKTRKALADRVAFYRELGIHDFYRRDVAPSPDVAPASEVAPASDVAPAPPPAGHVELQPESTSAEFPEQSSVKPKRDPAAMLRTIRDDLGDCTRCPLHRQGRKQIVFGVGNPHAEMMFVGEAPGADEDEQGEPFVGRAGQLLNNMIAAMGVRREDVYIANIIKCRPPGNRTPLPDECATCSPFLIRQVETIRPKTIVALGAVAARTLLGLNQPMNQLRGQWHEFRGYPLAVTFHPAYLLRNPPAKKDAWADLQMVMKYLGLKGKPKS